MSFTNSTQPLSANHNKFSTAVSPSMCNGASNQQRLLAAHVEASVREYFADLNGESSSQLYELIMAEVERPLFQVVLEHTNGNQSQCAKILGLNRGTLRKKLKFYGLI